MSHNHNGGFMLKKGLIAAMMALSVSSFSLNAEEINLANGYCSGKIRIDSPFSSNQEVEFSNGIKIKFFSEFDNEAMHYSGMGGMMVNDSSTNLFFKKAGEVKLYKSGRLSNEQNWQFAVNRNKWDTIWNSALSIPNETMESDSFAYMEESNVRISQASFLYSVSGSEMPDMFPSFREGMYSNYNSICYLESGLGRHIKIQAVEYDQYTYTYGPDDVACTVLSNVTLNWAADSAGNGRFLPEDTGIKNGFTKNENKQMSLSQLSIKNNLLNINCNSIESGTVMIHSLNGQLINKIKFDNSNKNIPINISSGVYISKLKTGNTIITGRIIVE